MNWRGKKRDAEEIGPEDIAKIPKEILKSVAFARQPCKFTISSMSPPGDYNKDGFYVREMVKEYDSQEAAEAMVDRMFASDPGIVSVVVSGPFGTKRYDRDWAKGIGEEEGEAAGERLDPE